MGEYFFTIPTYQHVYKLIKFFFGSKCYYNIIYLFKDLILFNKIFKLTTTPNAHICSGIQYRHAGKPNLNK